MKKALITGITGQDGSYLTELLLDKGYEVHGIIRRHSTPCTERIDHLLSDTQYDGRLLLHYGDLTDSSNAHRLIREIQPDEVYNLAAQSHVAVSFEVPEYTADAFLKRCARAGFPSAFTRHRRRSSLADFRILPPRARRRRFTQSRLMVRQNFIVIGLRRTIASLMGCLP